MDWYYINHFRLNTSKTKKMGIDLGKNNPTLVPVTIKDTKVKVVSSCRYLGVELDYEIDLSTTLGWCTRRVIADFTFRGD